MKVLIKNIQRKVTGDSRTHLITRTVHLLSVVSNKGGVVVIDKDWRAKYEDRGGVSRFLQFGGCSLYYEGLQSGNCSSRASDQPSFGLVL